MSIKTTFKSPRVSGGEFLPPLADTYDLGSAAFEWDEVYTGDDGGLILGLDQDIYVWHRSTAIAADEGDTDLPALFKGTASHPAIAANSLIVSNITSNGDIIFVVNDGGNSKGLLKLDGDSVFVADGVGLVVGHSAKITEPAASEFQALGTALTDASILIGKWGADVDPALLRFVKSRDPVIFDGTYAIVVNNDNVGQIEYYPDDGVDLSTLAALFKAEVDDSSPAAGDIGMAFAWWQMPGGGGAIRETLRLSAAGTLSIVVGDLIFSTASTISTSADDLTYSPAGISIFTTDVRIADTKGINTGIVDDDYFTIGAVDNDDQSITELMRFVGAADPYTLMTNGLFLVEQAAALADVASYGQFWVKNDAPNTPEFTDDTGVDRQIMTADYAAINFIRNAGAHTIDLVDVDELIEDWDTDLSEMLSNGDQANNKITIGATGVYKISFFGNAESAGANKDYEFHATMIAAATATITDITQATPGVVTTSAAHGLSNGNLVKLTAIVGMVELNDRVFKIANKADTTFELTDAEDVNIATGGLTAYDSAGTVQLATVIPASHTRRSFSGGAGDIGSFGQTGPVSLTKDDAVEAYVRGLTDATNLTIESATLAITRLS